MVRLVHLILGWGECTVIICCHRDNVYSFSWQRHLGDVTFETAIQLDELWIITGLTLPGPGWVGYGAGLCLLNIGLCRQIVSATSLKQQWWTLVGFHEVSAGLAVARVFCFETFGTSVFSGDVTGGLFLSVTRIGVGGWLGAAVTGTDALCIPEKRLKQHTRFG